MIQVGDRVRSYDFPFVDDIYVEGIVEAIEPWDGCSCDLPHIHIRVEVDTFPEGPSRVGELCFPVDPYSNAVGMFPPNGAASRIEIL